jgi:DNA-binding response OmpR family regulator
LNRVLVVDDEDDIRNLVHDILTGSGYEVFTASTGEEALTKVVAYKPDLVILDVVMSGMSGLEVCRLIKAKPNLKGTRVLMLSALSRAVDQKLIADAGADVYMKKPFSVHDLLSKIDELSLGEKPSKSKVL